MSLTTLEKNTVNRGCIQAKILIEQVKPLLDEMNAIYDSAGGVKTTITQEDLDAESSLSGLTKAQLDDGMFVLTSTLKGDLANGLTQLAQLAARAS